MVIRQMQYLFLSFRTREYYNLFSYTKLPEYVAEDLFGVDFANDFADVEDGFADVLGEEVGWELFGQTILYASESFASIFQ